MDDKATVKRTKVIPSFRGDFEYLSNFYMRAPFEDDSAAVWKSVEHYYQAAKTHHPTYRNNIYMCQTPGDAKFLGSRAPLRKNWGRVKENIMRAALLMKFSQNLDIAKKLVSTQDFLLIEGNTWHDNFWGSCICEKCAGEHAKRDPQYQSGLNRLGIHLMSVRNEVISNGELLLKIVKEG